MIICEIYSFVFWFEMVFTTLSYVIITSYINSCVYSNFNLRYFMSSFIYYITSLQIFHFYEFFCRNISQVELEILRNSSAIFRSSHRGVPERKLFSNILWYSQENTCVEVYFLIKLQAIRYALLLKETPTQIFSSEYREIYKKTYFEEH